MEQQASRGADQPAKAHQAPDVWTGELRSAASTRPGSRLMPFCCTENEVEPENGVSSPISSFSWRVRSISSQRSNRTTLRTPTEPGSPTRYVAGSGYSVDGALLPEPSLIGAVDTDRFNSQNRQVFQPSNHLDSHLANFFPFQSGTWTRGN